MKKLDSKRGGSPSQLISKQIAELDDWRGKLLGRLRTLIKEAAPDITEEWKWDTAVWSQNGLVCAASAFKAHVNIMFFKGGSLKDPKGIFNLDSKIRRSIIFREGDEIDESAFKDLIRAAVTQNMSGKK